MSTIIKSTGNLFPAFPTLFDDFLTRDVFSPIYRNFSNSSLPAVNIRETDSNYELEVAAPGMNKKDFNVELNNNTLVISAEWENSNEAKDSEERYSRREFNYRSFKRSFDLPQGMVEGDKVAARYRDGILYITVPKTEAARVKPPKQIQIA